MARCDAQSIGSSGSCGQEQGYRKDTGIQEGYRDTDNLTLERGVASWDTGITDKSNQVGVYRGRYLRQTEMCTFTWAIHYTDTWVIRKWYEVIRRRYLLEWERGVQGLILQRKWWWMERYMSWTLLIWRWRARLGEGAARHLPVPPCSVPTSC